MTVKPTNRFNLFLTLVPVLLLSACAGLPGSSLDNQSRLESEQASINRLKSKDNAAGDAAYHLMVAELAINRGLTELAVEHYLILARSQANPAIAERAVRVAVYGQDLEAAGEAARRWIELDPDQMEARQIIAAIYIRQNKIEEATQYLTELIENSKLEDEQLFLTLLGVLAREKNASAVLAVTHRLAQLYPDRAYAQFLHGMLSAQAGVSEEALVYLDKSIALEEIEGAHNARAKVLLKLGKRDEALLSLQKAVASRPDDQNLRLTYARLLVDMKLYELARAEFETLHLAAPNDGELLYTLGLLSLESERLDDAERYLLKLVDLDEREGEAEYYLGRVNESRKSYDVAIDWYKRVHVGEYRFDAQLRIATLLRDSDRFEEAHTHLKSMIKGSQSDASLVRIYLAEGDLLRSVKRYHDAVTVYDTALAVVPGNTDLLYARALTAERVGRLDILEADIRAILITEPDNAHALNALGFTLADQTERYEEAYELLKRAIEIMPDDAAIIDSFGWVNYRMGHFDEAIRLLRKALASLDDNEIAAHLGEVLWASGAKDEAKSVLQKALQKSPDDPIIQNVMRRIAE